MLICNFLLLHKKYYYNTILLKSGDLSTVEVFSTCPCDDSLSWVVVRDVSNINKISSFSKNFIQWGKEVGQPYDHRMHQAKNKQNMTDINQNSNPGYDDMCTFRIGYVFLFLAKYLVLFNVKILSISYIFSLPY